MSRYKNLSTSQKVWDAIGWLAIIQIVLLIFFPGKINDLLGLAQRIPALAIAIKIILPIWFIVSLIAVLDLASPVWVDTIESGDGSINNQGNGNIVIKVVDKKAGDNQ